MIALVLKIIGEHRVTWEVLCRAFRTRVRPNKTVRGLPEPDSIADLVSDAIAMAWDRRLIHWSNESGQRVYFRRKQAA